MHRSLTRIAIAALALTAASSARLCAQSTYRLTDIVASLWTNPQGSLAAINASGQIAGASTSGGFRWTPSSPNSPSGVFSLLPMPKGGTAGQAFGINNLGQAVGYAEKTNRGFHSTGTFQSAELWQPNGTIVDLVPGYAYGINDAGEVVGQNFLWINGKAYSQPGLFGAAINRSGQVCGKTYVGPDYQGYLWTPSSPNGGTGTSIPLPAPASGINDLGQVVGNMGRYLYTGGRVVYLGISDVGDWPAGINNKSQVAASHYLWDSVNGLRDLNDPTQFTLLNAAGWTFEALTGINDYGQIVGWGRNAAGEPRIFLLTPQ